MGQCGALGMRLTVSDSCRFDLIPYPLEDIFIIFLSLNHRQH